MELDSKGLRKLLISELKRRNSVNPAYTLRAFARSLKIAPSPLSEMIRGKRVITQKMAERILKALRMQGEFKSIKKADAIFGSPMGLDQFDIISDWSCNAILELMQTADFRDDLNWIAKRLGFDKSEVTQAVERLERVGLLRRTKGKWIDTSDGFTSSLHPLQTSSAAKTYQKAVLGQSIRSIDSVSIERRSHTSLTVAVNREDVPEAMRRIRKFQSQLCLFLSKKERKDEVYQMQVSFFPATYPEGDPQ